MKKNKSLAECYKNYIANERKNLMRKPTKFHELEEAESFCQNLSKLKVCYSDPTKNIIVIYGITTTPILAVGNRKLSIQ